MSLTFAQNLEGVLHIANIFLSIIAWVFALSLFRASLKRKELMAWKPMFFVLLFFSVHEILAVVKTFNISTVYNMTHVIPSIILGFMIYALALQIYVNKTAKGGSR